MRILQAVVCVIKKEKAIQIMNLKVENRGCEASSIMTGETGPWVHLEKKK